ncbi:MAG TPA: heparan-alpha-glucosaminide N-acetyltransferase domain-containing protein [Jiangellaceae bacterium]|nr:heparan-alpha-glucosaminide N-acetyltransferase domain-containing protein [Jiangellaceae bacterium]
MATATALRDPTRRRTRLAGVDAARGLALIGMMSVHVIPSVGSDGSTAVSSLIAGGRSAALFAVLAGVGLALASGGATAPRGRALARASAGTAARAVVLFVIGLTLGLFDSHVAVILAYYALLFLVAIPFLALRPGVLLPLAAAWAVVAPLISQAVRASMPPPSYGNPTFESFADPLGLVRELALTGYYPVFTWTAYILAGLGIGRLALNSTRVARWLLGGGVTLAIATWISSTVVVENGVLTELVAAGLGDHPASRPFADAVQFTGFYGTTPTTTWWWLTIASPHSGTGFDLLHTIGSAAAVLGLMLLIAKWSRGILLPLSTTGSMTLTLYSLHVVLLATILPRTTEHAFLVHVAIAIAIAVPWRTLVGRGPLEALAAAAAANAGNLVAPSAPRPTLTER